MSVISHYQIIELDTAGDILGRFLSDGLARESERKPETRRQSWALGIKEKSGETILAACKGYSAGHGFYISQLFVTLSARGKGLGALLIKKAEELARTRGCCECWVDTMSHQAPEFYKKLDYKEAGRIKNYNGPHDRIFFKKLL